MAYVAKKIEVTVYMEEDRRAPGGLKFLHLKVGSNPPAQLPTDVPAPRRLVQELLAAAAVGVPVDPKTQEPIA